MLGRVPFDFKMQRATRNLSPFAIESRQQWNPIRLA